MDDISVIHIKNMVCPRCIDTVKEILDKAGVETTHIELGKITVKQMPGSKQMQALSFKLKQRGFELLEDRTSKTITQIKSIVIDQIHHKKENLNINFSTLLSEKLNQEYSSLSKLFSTVEGITIEKYIVKQRIEKVKELIVYNELSLSEIAYHLNYSSVAHLSSQFKKETGMTPTAFKKLDIKVRNNLDAL